MRGRIAPVRPYPALESSAGAFHPASTDGMSHGSRTVRHLKARHGRHAALIATILALVAALAPSIALAGGRGATSSRASSTSTARAGTVTAT